MLRIFTENEVKKIQIDEGIVVLNLGLETEKILGPTRGGVAVTITPAIRDIEFDGRRGKTAGMQVKDGEDATVKVISLCCSQESLLYTLPNAKLSEDKKTIEQGDFGLIGQDQYIKTIDVVTQMLDKTYKTLKFNLGLHEGAFTYKAVSKAENEHNLEFIPHYSIDDDSRLFKIVDSDECPITKGD